MIVLYILLAIVILLFMVLIHEFGHYIAGKILKFKITEFSVGFGFPIFSKVNKKTGERFSLRIFPLGGYCAFDGEDDAEDSDFNRQKPWKRIIVFLAGVTANFLTAIIFSWILLCTMGYDIPKIDRVNSAYENPFEVGDVITHIDGKKIDFAFGGQYVNLVNDVKAEAKEFYKTHDDENFTFKMTVQRKGRKVVLDNVVVYEVTEENSKGEEYLAYYIGLESGKDETPCTSAYKFGFLEGFCRSFEMAFGFAWVVLKSLWLLITNLANKEIMSQAGGTIATISMMATMAQQSMSYLLILIPVIAANLAVFNLLPFPALDGSHVLFTLIEWIRGKPINRKVESMIHFIGICILFAFVILIDILHFVWK